MEFSSYFEITGN